MKLKVFLLFLLVFVCVNTGIIAGEGQQNNLVPEHTRSIVPSLLRTDTILTPAEAIPAVVMPNKEVEAVLINQAMTAMRVRLNPRAVSFVKDYMAKNSEDLNQMKDWGKPYFNTMDNILAEYGLPTELKYLAVIESKLKSKAVSMAGAVGPWQFMPATARAYGLKVTKGRDDRTDYYKSTDAAARYLKYLFSEFEDWLLVIAAYNGGPGYVYSAIKKSKSRNFWVLQNYLPAESRNHVKKFISAHYIFEGQGGITTLTKAEATEQIGSLAGYLSNRQITGEELNASKTTTISGKYHSKVISKYIDMDIEDFNRYNPDFDKLVASSQNGYELKLPSFKMETFVANKYPILNESVQEMLKEGNTSENEASKNITKDQPSSSAAKDRPAANNNQLLAVKSPSNVLKDHALESGDEATANK